MAENEDKKNNEDENENEKKNYYIKIILLGETGIGKTNLINVYFDPTSFNSTESSTSNPTQSYKLIEKNDIKFHVSIWDTMGQEKHRALTENFIKGSNIVIFVYDLTRKQTFKDLDYWVKIVKDKLAIEKVTFGVAANKIDLFDKGEVEKEEGQEYAKKINALFCETSAKTNPKSFSDFIQKLLGKYLLDNKIIQNIDEINENNKNIHLNENVPKKKNKKCCI